MNFKGRKKVTAWWSYTVSGVTKSAEELHDLVRRRSSSFLARWKRRECQNVEKKSMNSDDQLLLGGC